MKSVFLIAVFTVCSVLVDQAHGAFNAVRTINFLFSIFKFFLLINGFNFTLFNNVCQIKPTRYHFATKGEYWKLFDDCRLKAKVSLTAASVLAFKQPVIS